MARQLDDDLSSFIPGRLLRFLRWHFTKIQLIKNILIVDQIVVAANFRRKQIKSPLTVLLCFAVTFLAVGGKERWHGVSE